MILDSKKIVQNSNTDAVVFEAVLAIIERARVNVFRTTNRELISMYWAIRRCASEKVTASNWGKAVVQNEAEDWAIIYDI
jgi:hypothetical protein